MVGRRRREQRREARIVPYIGLSSNSRSPITKKALELRPFLCLALKQTSLFPEEVDKIERSYGLLTVNTLQ